ncbi:MAG: LysR substrate-binding domain-containing protein [Lachnospiraceae bacterium]|nr:LysR substrate-binding domain-containing protein [Lachnospiraceae bacterium]
MDSTFLKILVEIAKFSNITKAANNLGYTQSGLSHTLNRVEDDMGFKLFLRSKKGVTLTEEGSALLPIAKEIVTNMEKLHETITSIQGLEQGKITIGSFTSISMNILPSILMAFSRDYPGIKIELMEGSVTEIQEWIMDRTIDIGFTSLQDNDEFEYTVWFDDPLLAIVPKDYENRNNNFFDIKEFENHPFIMPATERGYDYDIEKIVEKHGLNLNVKLSSKSDMAIIKLVARGLGFTILPELITLGNTSAVKALPILPYSCRKLGMGSTSIRNSSPATKKFIEYTNLIIQERKIKMYL